jgi:DNA-binding NarL/FixJ family response regulator
MAKQIYIVEDHPVVRRGLSSLIEPESDLTISGETGSAKEAREHLSASTPDLVILDLSLEEGSGLHLLEHLHSTQPDLRILVVSMHDEVLYARRALDNGAQGYLMKSNATEKVVEAIRHVLDGNVYLSPEMTSAIVTEHVGGSGAPDRSPLDNLTDRELEVLMLMGEGYERREIAESLALSPKTIDTYKNHLQKKLSLDTNAGLRRYAAVWVASGEQPPE